MKPVDVLEWTMGWAWPVMVVLAALIFIGIERLVNWEVREPSRDTTSVRVPKRRYVRVRSSVHYMRIAGNFRHRGRVLIRSARQKVAHSR